MECRYHQLPQIPMQEIDVQNVQEYEGEKRKDKKKTLRKKGRENMEINWKALVRIKENKASGRDQANNWL